MPLTDITPEFLAPYFRGKKKHIHYDETVKLYNGLRIHADGEWPRELIEERRPFESIEVKNYRKKIWAAITEETVGRVINSLSKIRTAQDWLITYPEKANTAITDTESLYNYCEVEFPYTDSISNWMFSVALKQYLIDANGICVMIPINPAPASNEYLQPSPIIFNSTQVLDYVEGEYGIFYSDEKSTYKISLAPNTTDVTKTDGDVYYVVTTEKIERWKQVDVTKKMELDWEYLHGCDEPPMFKLGGVFFKHKDTIFLFKSRINTMVPYLNEAVREYSDLQAEVVQHIHSEKWEMAVEDCKQCRGLGKIQTGDGWGTCTSCKGRGKIDQSPYSKMLVRPAGVGESPIPIPPAGYISKSVEIVKIQDERVENHKYNALASLNMEFLADTPLNQSGKAKEVDRSELNNFVSSVAADIVYIMEQVYDLVNEMRYGIIVSSPSDREKLLPTVNTPFRFDILDADTLMTEFEKARNANISPYFSAQLELAIVVQRFSTSPEIKDKFIAINELDPLVGVSIDAKTLYNATGVIPKIDFITSINITQFVNRAIQENGNKFFELKFEAKQAIIQKYAQEKLDLLDKQTASAKAKTIAGANAGQGDGDIYNTTA